MNRVGRMSFLILLGGALLLPFGVYTYAQSEGKDPASDKQQDSGKKKPAP